MATDEYSDGRYRLEVRVIEKPGPAVMDLRAVKLIPIGNERN